MSLRSIGVALVGSLFVAGLGYADETSAREYLAEGASTAYLQEGLFQLERIEPRQDVPDGSIVFQKIVNGLPLHGARVIVVEENDVVQYLFHDSVEQLNLRPGPIAIPLDGAIAVAEESTENAMESVAEIVWFRSGNDAVLAWQITTSLDDSGDPVSPTHLETVVDAETGAVLSQRQIDTKEYAPGTPETEDGVFPRIVINNAIGAAGARAYAAPFDAVVEVAFGCTGTLIAQDVVLCARHCGVGSGDTVIFGDNANGGGIYSATVASSFLPDGGGSLLDGGDVSILTLTANVPSNIAEPMRLIEATDDLEGMLCATLGYGYNGLGSQGHGFSADGFRWGGENIIDVYGSPASANGSNIISTDFDNGSAGNNTIPSGSPVPVEYEATTAPGDSGGPVLVLSGGEWVIAGVLSGGTTSTSVYGDISWWTGTAIYREDIEQRGGQFIGSTELTLPDGLPQSISPAGGDTLSINAVESETDGIVPGSGRLHVDTGSGFQSYVLTQDSETGFTGTFPASECLSIVGFYISFDLESGAVAMLPSNAPDSFFSVLSTSAIIDVFNDSFDTDLNWSVSGNATDGQWERAIPNNGDRGDPAVDAEDDGAGFCFVTDNGNIPNDNTDVDGGSTILTSPILDASGDAGETAYLSYYRWYSNDFGAAPNTDIFEVEISNNGGSTWTSLETVGPSGPGTSGGWIFVEFRVDDIIAPTSNMRLRFTASDLGEGSVVEAGVDGVQIRLASCDDDSCPADFDGSGSVDTNDLLSLLAAWGPCGDCPEDLNDSGAVDTDDLLGLLAAWGVCE